MPLHITEMKKLASIIRKHAKYLVPHVDLALLLYRFFFFSPKNILIWQMVEGKLLYSINPHNSIVSVIIQSIHENQAFTWCEVFVWEEGAIKWLIPKIKFIHFIQNVITYSNYCSFLS